MGDYDVVKAVLSRIADMRWMQIAIKPAKPFAFGLLAASDGRQVPVFGLPGQPRELARELRVARPAGAASDDGPHRRSMRPTVEAIADVPLQRRPDGKIHYVRVHGEFGADGRVPRAVGRCAGQPPAGGHRDGQRLAVVPDGDGVAGATSGNVLPVILPRSA